MRTGYIYQIPVIDVTGIAQVKIKNLFPFRFFCFLKFLYSNYQCTQTCFMKRAFYQFLQFG